MTERIKTTTGTLRVRATDNRVILTTTKSGPSHESLSIGVPTRDLLAAIDRADPDAMRAYLRETTERGAITVNVHAVEPDSADLARRIERALNERIDAVPEADSPEDVDEHAVIELSDDIDTRLHVIERLAKILRAGTDAVEVCTLADWVIDR